MRKKEILCLLISFVMLLTSLLPVTVSAEKTVSIYDTYTFEEFIALDEDTLLEALESEVDETLGRNYPMLYKETREMAPQVAASGNYHSFIFEYEEPWGERYLNEGYTQTDFQADSFNMESWLSDIRIPNEILVEYIPITTCPCGSGKHMEVYFDREAHVAYNCELAEFIAKLHLWLTLSPLLAHVDYCGVYGTETTTTTTTTTTEPPVITAVEGDTNLDGRLSVVDVITISKYNAKVLTLNEAQLLACDCNGDGVVDNGDVIDLMKFIVGIYDALPMAG